MTSRMQWREVPCEDPHHRFWVFEMRADGEYLGHVEQFDTDPELGYAWGPFGRIGAMRGVKAARRVVKRAVKAFMRNGSDWIGEQRAKMRNNMRAHARVSRDVHARTRGLGETQA